ncbi:MAG: YicC family protein [Bacteroidales bacterium]|nr:YicC family protein [Bacteroidales bacterium]
MVKSMTGYGKAEASLGRGKLCVEIRSLNGKGAEITVKSSILPKDREMELRKAVSEALVRGNIDVYVNLEQGTASVGRLIDTGAVMDYMTQLNVLKAASGVSISSDKLFEAALRFPDVIAAPKSDVVDDENWPVVLDCVLRACGELDGFRCLEGVSLRADVLEKVSAIHSAVDEVEKYEAERVETVRARILSRFAELGLDVDKDRLESEMIYYIEKFDINEEKTRLRQHCRYFVETVESEGFPGKKLGFIAQEMGREINTLGSKANHTEIQRIVVGMKDNLEKIKEQSMNIL